MNIFSVNVSKKQKNETGFVENKNNNTIISILFSQNALNAFRRMVDTLKSFNYRGSGP